MLLLCLLILGYCAVEYKVMLSNHYTCSLLALVTIPGSLKSEHTLPEVFVVQSITFIVIGSYLP